MTRRMSIPSRVACTVLALAIGGAANAATPVVVWQQAGATSGVFSSDGSAVLLTVTNGFEMRRATDGALLGHVTLPASSPGYDTFAFSPDKQYVATTKRENGISRIDVWRLSDGSLFRTIDTGAVRNIKALSLSSTGLVASMERFAYGGGGTMEVHRLSDGALVRTLGPYTRSSSTDLHFSPNGQYLQVLDRVSSTGFRVLRTSDWSSALTEDGVDFLQWSNDGAAFWTYGSSYYAIPFEKVGVPSGAVLHSVTIDDALQLSISAITPDGNHYLAYQASSTDPGSPRGDVVDFVRASDGTVELTYQFPNPLVWSGSISPNGALFDYVVCIGGTDCTYSMARMPNLGGAASVGEPASDAGPALSVGGANPFHRSVDIHWSLPRAGRATLDVYDLGGHRVRRLADGSFAAGPRTVTWDGRGEDGRPKVAGIYFLKLDALGQHASLKLVHLP